MTDYYIDPSIGAGLGGDGLTTGTPKGDLSDVLPLTSNNNYYFKAGEVQDFSAFAVGNQIDFAGAHDITIGAYGTGARPIMNGLDDLRSESWSAAGSDVYTMARGDYARTEMSQAATGGTYRRERVFRGKVGLKQATDEYFVANGVDATYPIYWDSTHLYYYHTGGSPAADGTIIESLKYRHFIRLNGAYNITIKDIDLYGMRVIAETLSVHDATNIVFDNFCSYYGCMAKTQLAMYGTGTHKIKGFKFYNGSKLEKNLQAGEEPSNAADKLENESFGGNNGITLRDNVGESSGGALGDGALIQDFELNGFGHTTIQLTMSTNAAYNISMRDVLVERGTIDCTNSNHGRAWALFGLNTSNNVIRNIEVIKCRAASTLAGDGNYVYNIIWNTPLEDNSPSAAVPSATSPNGGCFAFENSTTIGGGVFGDCINNYAFNMTFYNSQNSAIQYHAGGINNASESTPNYFYNLIFDECCTTPTDVSTAGTCVYLEGSTESQYNKQQTIVWDNIRCYHSTHTPQFHLLAPGTYVGTDYTAATATSTFANMTDLQDADTGLDNTDWSITTGGSAYNAGTTVSISGLNTAFDYYRNPRPGAGASSTAWDIGAVEYQDDSGGSVSSATHTYSLRRKIATL